MTTKTVATPTTTEIEELENILKGQNYDYIYDKMYDWAAEGSKSALKIALIWSLSKLKEKQGLHTGVKESFQKFKEYKEEELEDEQIAHQATKQKLNNLQNQLNNHVCSGAGNSTSPATTDNDSHNQTSEEKDKTVRGENGQNTVIRESQEHIIRQINQNPTLNQVISKIKELIHKPPTSSFMASPSNQNIKKSLQDAQQTIVKLEQELSEKSTPFGEDLAVIKQLELNSLEHLFKQKVDTDTINKIQQATNYQQVVATRQAFLQKHLEQKENTVPTIVTKNEWE